MKTKKEILNKLKEDIKFRRQFGMIAEAEITYIIEMITEAFKKLK